MTPEDRIDLLETRAALRDLAGRYALAVDGRDIATLAALFAPDAVFRSVNGGFRAETRDGIAAEFTRQLRGLGPSFHFTHDQTLELLAPGDARASGTVTAHAEVRRDGAMWWTAIRYHDNYVRIDGRWLFAERALAFFYYLPAADYPYAVNDLARMRAGGGVGDADWPEPTDTWRRFYAA